MLPARRARHDTLSALLASCTERELAALVDSGRGAGVGVGGGSAVLDVGGVAVFAKRIPLTDREFARPRCAANLFDLPVFCREPLHLDGHFGNLPHRRHADLPHRLRPGHLAAVRPVGRRAGLRPSPRHARRRLRRHATGQLAGDRGAAARMNSFCWKLFGGDVHAEYPGREVSGGWPRR